MPKQTIPQNPFHPLDLSAHDLLTVYKKFDVSREANRNPKHQLPIETISQLISSLKGCKPSYVQKCVTEAFGKSHISWSQFLAFLDEEIEVREKIWDWLIYQKSIVKYRFLSQMPFRNKILEHYDTISNINFINLGEDRLMLVAVDNKRLMLIDITENKFVEIDSMTHTNKKNNFVPSSTQLINQSLPVRNIQKSVVFPKNKMEKQRNLSINKSSLYRSEKVMPLDSSTHTKFFGVEEEKQAYYKKERKNIHALFNLFNDLPLQQSKKVAELTSERIQNRTINLHYVNQVRQTYQQMVVQRKNEQKTSNRIEQEPIERASKILQSLHQQKNNLTYNPYKSYKLNRTSEPSQNIFGNGKKKLNHDRKQKQYSLQAIQQKYCAELNLIAVVYYNLQLCLVKVAREYKKIVFEQQDTLKIVVEKDYKKNEVIEMIQFYYHVTTCKWFLLVLFRYEHKYQPRSHNESFIKGYEIKREEGKRKGDRKYIFAKDKQEFVIDLGMNQVIKLLAQKQYGLHLITHNGKYFLQKEEYYIEDRQTVYWKKENEQKFKGATLSLSCICVSVQLNKAILGTNKGTLIIYDIFNKKYKMHKISNYAIVQVQVQEREVFILCENQKIIIYDIFREEQIQILNVKKQEKLHEKIEKFTLHQGKIVCFGTNIRVFEKFTDSNLQKQKLKLQKVYTWRLRKIENPKSLQQAPDFGDNSQDI